MSKFIVVTNDGIWAEGDTYESAVRDLDKEDLSQDMVMYRRVGAITPKTGVEIDDPDGLLP